MKWKTPVIIEIAVGLELLERLDRIFTDHPVYGSRRLQVALLREEISVGRRRVRRLMRKLGLWAVRPKRNTSKRHPGHKVYPYLLRGKTIDQPNQAWAADITYIPMRQGFLYLVAIIDWATRRVLSWRLSNTPCYRSVPCPPPRLATRKFGRRLLLHGEDAVSDVLRHVGEIRDEEAADGKRVSHDFGVLWLRVANWHNDAPGRDAAATAAAKQIGAELSPLRADRALGV